MNTPTLKTERLILRKFAENDLEALYRIYSDVDVNRFLPWFPVKSIEEAKTLLSCDVLVVGAGATGVGYVEGIISALTFALVSGFVAGQEAAAFVK